MSYRSGKNAADTWRMYCSENRALLDFIGISEAVLRNEGEFRRFMIRGEFDDDDDQRVTVSNMSDDQLQSLWRFVNHIVPFDMDVTLFDRFNEEYRRRFAS